MQKYLKIDGVARFNRQKLLNVEKERSDIRRRYWFDRHAHMLASMTFVIGYIDIHILPADSQRISFSPEVFALSAVVVFFFTSSAIKLLWHEVSYALRMDEAFRMLTKSDVNPQRRMDRLLAVMRLMRT